MTSADTNFNGLAELTLPDGSFDWAFVNSGRLIYEGAVKAMVKCRSVSLTH